jgi:predicted type IV restriction endonuclease
MKKQIVSYVKDLKAKKMHSKDEAAIKQAVVLRLLSYLGWDIFDVEEVCPDFAAGSGVVSYALRVDSGSKVLLEVKRQSGGYDDVHRDLVALAAAEGVELAAHTDGSRWWFYLPAAKGGLSQKRCQLLDALEQKPEDMALELIALLSREKVAGGDYLESARAAYQQQKRKMAAEVLPDAWNKVLAGPNKILVEILSDATEKICGCKAEPGMVEAFLRANLGRWALPPAIGDSPAPPAPAARPAETQEPEAARAVQPPEKSTDMKARKPEFFANKAIDSFSFRGNTFPVKTWEEMLTTVCDYFAVQHPHEFEKVLWLYDDQHPFFSRYSDQLRIPEKIKKTNIYVETKLAPEEIVKTVGDLLTEFGYGHEELVINTQ